MPRERVFCRALWHALETLFDLGGRVSQILTTVLEIVAVVAILAGAVSVVVGIVPLSVPLAFIVGGCELAGLGVGGLWLSKKVTE